MSLIKLDARPTFDRFSRELQLNGDPFDDVTLDRLWVQCDDEFGFRPSKALLETVIRTEGHDRSVHPVHQYLDGLRWDGVPRLDRIRLWILL